MRCMNLPKVLIISGMDFEDLELFYPLFRLKEAGFDVHIASYTKELTGKHGYKVKVDLLLKDVKPEEYIALVLPGGKGPERVRLYARDEAIKIVKHFVENNKPIAAICHGPQLLISAGALKGRTITCYAGIRDDVEAAGAKWINSEVVVDKNFVTSRVPTDTPAWFREFMKLLKK